MLTLEKVTKGSLINGIIPYQHVEIIDARWHGGDALEITYKTTAGRVDNEILYRDNEPTLEILEAGAPWSFSASPELFRLAAEAYRICQRPRKLAS